MILSPKVAMPHASMNNNVYETGFSMIITKEPIIFGKNNTSVQIFIILAATDKVKHIQALKEIMYLFENEKIMTLLLSATTNEEVRYILKKYTKNILMNKK